MMVKSGLDFFYFEILRAPSEIPGPFLSTLQNMGVKFLQGVENFHQGEVLFVQAAYKFYAALARFFFCICT